MFSSGQREGVGAAEVSQEIGLLCTLVHRRLDHGFGAASLEAGDDLWGGTRGFVVTLSPLALDGSSGILRHLTALELEGTAALLERLRSAHKTTLGRGE